MFEINTIWNKNGVVNTVLEELDKPINKSLGEVLTDGFLFAVGLIVTVILIAG